MKKKANPEEKTKTKKQSVKSVVDSIIADFGDDNVIVYKDKLIKYHPTTGRSSGFVGFDVATGIEGLPSGCFVELFGPESAGKTTLAIQMIGEAHHRGEMVCYIDVEHRVNLAYAETISWNRDERFLFLQPSTGEDGFQICERLMKNGFTFFVIDSMAALISKKEHNEKGPAGQRQPGVQAKMISDANRLLTPLVSRSESIILYTNQLRDNLSPFGASEKTPGGRSPKFYNSLRIRISREGKAEPWGHFVKCEMKKNSLSIPFTKWIGRLVYGKGFDPWFDLIETGVELGVIQKRGNQHIFAGLELGVGRAKASTSLKDDIEVADKLRAAILEA